MGPLQRRILLRYGFTSIWCKDIKIVSRGYKNRENGFPIFSPFFEERHQNEIYLSWIFFPHPAHSWGPAVFWGSALTDIVMMLKRKREEAIRSRLKNGIFVPKLFWPTVIRNFSSDREILLKFEAEGREFAKILRSLEQFVQTVKGQNNFW